MKHLLLIAAFATFAAMGAVAQTSNPDPAAALLKQATAAQNAKNWSDAESAFQQLVTLAPDRLDYQKGLADSELNLGHYEDAVASYDAAIALARKDIQGTGPTAAKIKGTLGAMLANKGNAYLKLKRNPEAIAAYSEAAAIDPHPGTAYFNLCATSYNAGDMQSALTFCDKAITADTKKADAYFAKGSALMGFGELDKNGNFTAPAGTGEALQKYLALAPNGGHAADVKEMLSLLGKPVTTTYQKQKDSK